MRKPLLSVFFIAVMVGGLAFAASSHFGTVQASTDVTGIIGTDTTWTKANIPYNLTGNLLVNNGVTLIIQPGVTVNLNSYYIMVNGTLTAKGSSNDKIYFNGGQITFTQYSNGWNQETQSGSIIQYAVISGLFTTGGAIYIDGGSPAILNNNMNVTIGITGGSPIISGNIITGVKYATFSGGSRYASEGIYINYGSSSSGTPIISDNIISGSFDDASISIGGGSPIIQRNLISGGHIGIDMISLTSSYNPRIKNNTITSCYRGVSVGSETLVTFTYNNLEDISNYSIYSWRTTNNFNATYNWWGTTDTSVIDQKIYDYNDDFNLGKVNYTPFLTEPNTQAVPDPNAPLPTTPAQTPSTSPTPTPSQEPQQPDLTIIVGVAIAAVVIGAGLGLLIYLIKRK
jgi:parallel beta-helix repeat protein